MNEFLKLTWRSSNDEQQLSSCFLPEEIVSESYVYKTLSKPLKAALKWNVKLKFDKNNCVPGKKYYRLVPRRSLLTKVQKSHCLMALKLLQSGKKPESLTAKQSCSLKIYSECQPKIIEENRRFLEFIQNIWTKNHGKPKKCRPGIYKFAWTQWMDKIDRYLCYPQFYKEVSLLSLSFDENEAVVDFQQIINALEMGTLARFNHPNFKEPCILRLKHLQNIEAPAELNSKLPVSQDENVAELAEKYDFNVVISSSALKQLVDYTNVKNKWTIPVVVRQLACKKIVFIDKVLPKTRPSCHDLDCFAYKRLLKLQFCQYEAFSFPVQDTPLESQVLNSDGAPDKTIHHNVSYRIWNVRRTDIQNTLMKNKTQDKEIKLLVRTKLDACEDSDDGVLFPVIIRPKLEQQLQYGVNIPTKSELARDWTSLFFRIYSNLYRARLYGPTSEIVSVEKSSIQKINLEAQTHYNYKPMLGLGVLQKVLATLVDLECGNYVLQHLPRQESFLSLMKECDEEAPNAFDLHAECDAAMVDYEAKRNWLPVDVNYILPVHEEYGQIPGVFHGLDKIQKKKSKGKGKPKGNKMDKRKAK